MDICKILWFYALQVVPLQSKFVSTGQNIEVGLSPYSFTAIDLLKESSSLKVSGSESSSTFSSIWYIYKERWRLTLYTSHTNNIKSCKNKPLWCSSVIINLLSSTNKDLSIMNTSVCWSIAHKKVSYLPVSVSVSISARPPASRSSITNQPTQSTEESVSLWGILVAALLVVPIVHLERTKKCNLYPPSFGRSLLSITYLPLLHPHSCFWRQVCICYPRTMNVYIHSIE